MEFSSSRNDFDDEALQLFTITPITLSFGNLRNFLKIVKYNFRVSRRFPKGFVLSEPIVNSRGGMLIPEKTEISPEIIAKLAAFLSPSSKETIQVSVFKDSQIAELFRKQIKNDFYRILEAKKTKQEYRRSFARLEKTLDLYLGDVLASDELIYILARGKAIDEFVDENSLPRFYYHSINVSILALQLMQNARHAVEEKFEKQDLLNILILSLLHDLGSIENLGRTLYLPPDKMKRKYLLDTQHSFVWAKMIDLDNTMVKALKLYSTFHQGETEDLQNSEGRSADYANMLIVADLCELKVSGLFDKSIPLKTAIDNLYLMVNNKLLKKGYVDALAKAFMLTDLFNFYYELERLDKSCLKKKYAKAYPMQGFASPVLYICTGNRTDCPEFAPSSSTVNLLRPTAGLEAGVYGRCKLLSTKLAKFYESHYADIKENIQLYRRNQLKNR